MDRHSKAFRQQVEGPMVGFGFGIENRELEIECFGSPHEVVTEVELKGLTFSDLLEHEPTGVKARAIYKDGPESHFFGGGSMQKRFSV